MVLSKACLKGRQSHCSQPWKTLVFSHLDTSSYSFSYESICPTQAAGSVSLGRAYPESQRCFLSDCEGQLGGPGC